jgi:hypothetical protein
MDRLDLYDRFDQFRPMDLYGLLDRFHPYGLLDRFHPMDPYGQLNQ